MLPLIFSLPGSLGSETILYFLGGILAPAFLASDKATATAWDLLLTTGPFLLPL